MDKEYDNTNSGAMFVNDRKTNDRQPDRNGSCVIECPDCGAKTDFWASGWVKKAKSSGKTFLSLAFTAKEEKPPASDGKDFDDDMPF